MIFLSRAEVLRIHDMLLRLYGGGSGVRDEGLLESALAQPDATFGGERLHADVAEMAAAYGYHLAKNHPFVDGNKRIALAAMLVFLEVNGRPLHVDREDLYALMIAVADGRVGKAALAAWLREKLGLAPPA
jgi:death on curing protein